METKNQEGLFQKYKIKDEYDPVKCQAPLEEILS